MRNFEYKNCAFSPLILFCVVFVVTLCSLFPLLGLGDKEGGKLDSYIIKLIFSYLNFLSLSY